jgi:hypothetical protein
MARDSDMAAILRIDRREAWLASVICVVATALLAVFYMQTSALKHLDSVFLFESIESISQGYEPVSRTVATWPEALRLFSVPAADVCAAPLAATEIAPYNVFDNHAYVNLYPLGLISSAIGPEVTLAIVNALAHVLLLFLPYVFLRRRGAPWLAALGFATCVALYAGWSYSAGGEYYLDRLYMPLALAAAYLGHRLFIDGEESPRILVLFLLCAFAAAASTERAALMMSGLLAFFVVLQPRSSRVSNYTTAVVSMSALALIGYVFVYFKWVFVGIEGGGDIIANAMAILRAPLERMSDAKWVAFGLVNLSLAAFALFAGWRHVLLLVGSMLPNFLVSTGGAEISGWATHYHTMYIPFLIFVASVGYARVASWLSRPAKYAFALSALGLTFAWTTMLDPATGMFGKPSLTAIRQGIVGRVTTYYLKPAESHDRAAAAAARSLDELVPKNVRVSAIEGAMPALYRGRHVLYYPIGLNEVDYVVISGSVKEGDVTGLSGAVSYLGPSEAEALNRCLAERLKRSGFRLAGTVASIGLVVLQREPPSAVGSGG